MCPPKVLHTDVDRLLHSNRVYWIDLDNPTEDEEELVLRQCFPVHMLTFLDITQRHHGPDGRSHLPKVEAFPDYLFVVVNPLREEFVQHLSPGQPHTMTEAIQSITQLSAVLTHNILITHHREPLQSIRDLHHFLGKHQDQAGRGPDYLFHLVLDGMVDRFAPVQDDIQDVLERIEDEVFLHPTQEILQQLLSLKRCVTTLRKTLVYEREVLARLIRGDLDLIDVREMAYYRNVYDHVVRSTELIESSREMVNDLMQTYMSAMSNRLNEVMKVLTMISTVVLPMTLIAGIYGMNFHDMPELEQPWGYPLALAGMAATGIVAFIFFRWRGWL
jgi:magnesium transporter